MTAMKTSSTLLLCAAAASSTTAPCRADAFAPGRPRRWRPVTPLSPPGAQRRLRDGGASLVTTIADLRGGASTSNHGPPRAAELRSAPGGTGGDSKPEDGTGENVVGRAASGIPLLEALAKIVAKVRPTSTIRAVFGAVPSFWYWIRSSNRGDGDDEEGTSGGPVGHRSFVDALHSAKTYRLCVLYVLGYLALSVGAYSYGFERWPVVDSLYFAVTCFTSVGYGDICPQTRAAKIFTAFFVLYGISILGIALGIVGSSLVEAEQNAVGRAGDRVKRRLLKRFRRGRNAEPSAEPRSDEPAIGAFIAELVLTQLPNLALIGGLALCIGRIEGWSVPTSLYYGVITTTTVGLGDFSPSTPSARLLAVFFIPLSVAVLGELLGRVAGFFVDREAERAEREFLARDMTEEDLALMDEDENGDVDLAEFMTFMLVTMGKVDRETMDELRAAFESMDVEGNGVLNKKDLEVLALRKGKAA